MTLVNLRFPGMKFLVIYTASAFPASVWDITAPLSEVLYLIQGADLTSNLSAFPTPSPVPLSLTIYSQRRVERPVAEGVDESWSMNFMSDELFDGRRIRLLTIVEEHRCPGYARL